MSAVFDTFDVPPDVPDGFSLVFKDKVWTAFAKDDITLYRMAEGEWCVSVNQCWVSGVFSTAEEAVEAASQ